MTKVEFLIPDDQEQLFGDASALPPAGVTVAEPERTLGHDGVTLLLISMVAAPLVVDVLSAWIYDRFFKRQEKEQDLPQRTSNAAPIMIIGERVCVINSPKDVERIVINLSSHGKTHA